MLLYLECYKNVLSKGVNILLGQPVLCFIFVDTAFLLGGGGSRVQPATKKGLKRSI